MPTGSRQKEVLNSATVFLALRTLRFDRPVHRARDVAGEMQPLESFRAARGMGYDAIQRVAVIVV
jgi:hypothetical protein